MTVVENLAPNSDKSTYKDYEIKFPKPFGEVPEGIADKIVIVATIELQGMDYPDCYSVNVGNITKDGFTARVIRLDGVEGWGMTLQLNYIAQQNTIFSAGV